VRFASTIFEHPENYVQPSTRSPQWFAGIGILLLCFAAGLNAQVTSRKVDVGGYGIWMQVAGEGKPTVVFESGGGDDSSVWAKIEPEIRQQCQVRTVVYDRAGLGKSDPKPGPYRIEDEAAALQRALDAFGIRGPILLVAHSYGGFVSTLVAAHGPRVAGMVLVDANLAGFFDDAEVQRLLAKYSPQFDALRQARPDLARVMIPMMQAYPETAKTMRRATIPASLPVIDIVAEKTWVDSPQELASMRKAHADFVAASSSREAVFAGGSSHQVMRDRPDLVIAAVEKLVKQIRPGK
jgi:pimeloyl-ACP methyl ester carboxylesterase